MSDQQNYPLVVAAPGVTPQDGHEHFWSPRNIIAFALVAGFLLYSFMPYLFRVPVGRAGDLITSNGKVIETIVVLVIGFFFGTTVNSARREARNEQSAAAAAAAVQRALPPPDPAPRIVIDPPATLELKDALDGQDPDARARSGEPAGLPASAGLRPRDDGPAE